MNKIIISLISFCIVIVTILYLLESREMTRLSKQFDDIQHVITSMNAQWAKFELDDGNVILSGRTIEAKKHKQLIQKISYISGIKNVTSTIKTISPLSALECQREVNSHAASHPFRFNPQGELIANLGSPLITRISETLALCPDYQLFIISHTNNILDAVQNKILSTKRAESIKSYLIKTNSINPNRILTIGMGASYPIADNSTANGRRLNDRVELKIQ